MLGKCTDVVAVNYRIEKPALRAQKANSHVLIQTLFLLLLSLVSSFAFAQGAALGCGTDFEQMQSGSSGECI
jgi:hypothetical protein